MIPNIFYKTYLIVPGSRFKRKAPMTKSGHPIASFVVAPRSAQRSMHHPPLTAAMSCSCRLFGLLLSLCGVALSLYAYYVEVMMEASAASGAGGGDKYEALCDVSEKVSCTKVFNTSFAKGFGVVDKIVGEWTCAETLHYVCISFKL